MPLVFKGRATGPSPKKSTPLAERLRSILPQFLNDLLFAKDEAYAEHVDCYQRAQDYLRNNEQVQQVFGGEVMLSANAADINSYKMQKNGFKLQADPLIIGPLGQGKALIRITSSRIGATVSEQFDYQISTPLGELLNIQYLNSYTEAKSL